jgi:hypothetical protein
MISQSCPRARVKDFSIFRLWIRFVLVKLFISGRGKRSTLCLDNSDACKICIEAANVLLNEHGSEYKPHMSMTVIGIRLETHERCLVLLVALDDINILLDQVFHLLVPQ